ncbi:MAG TPA: 4Fe-4S binding protein [Clostridia bacterium]|nr:4Fe-4S binding protein [Clostridia bacterium]
MKRLLACALSLLLVVSLLLVTGHEVQAKNVVEINITARQFEYEPNVIKVRQGDLVRLNLIAEDVTHGLYIEEYDLFLEDQPQDPVYATVEFVADKTGTFPFRCSVVCGPMHPFMVGRLVVEPNTTTPISLALAVFVGFGSLGYVYRKRNRFMEQAARQSQPKDLTSKFGWLYSLLKQRWFQFSLIAVNTFFFVIILFAGYAGTSLGNANFAIIFVWFVWWALLILILLPLGGRIWCAMCPLPAPGEWLDHRAFIVKGREKPRSLALKWPKRFQNIWLQNWSFLIVALFSGIILTRPLATAVVLSLFIVLAIIFSLIYGRRIFCRYVCPVGGFIGLYSLVAPFGVRIADPAVCRAHKEKECIMGNDKGYGCPWMEVPWNLRRNAYCGLCTECFKTCSQNNVRLVWHGFGRDLLVDKGKKLDEAYKAFIMLTCSLVYSLVFLSAWGDVKSWANLEMPGFIAYAIGFLLTNLVVTPLLFSLAVWVGKGWAEKRFPPVKDIFYPVQQLLVITKGLIFGTKEQPATGQAAAETAVTAESKEQGIPYGELFVNLAYVLVPMGLACWMAFSISFIFTNGVYVLHVLSDPFGWHWDLLGLKSVPWKPMATSVYPLIQAVLLLAGLFYSVTVGARLVGKYAMTAAQKVKLLLPVTVFLIGVAALFLFLHM